MFVIPNGISSSSVSLPFFQPSIFKLHIGETKIRETKHPGLVTTGNINLQVVQNCRCHVGCPSPYQAIHLADPYRSNYGPWPLKFADPPADNGAADDGKLHWTKNRKKRMQQKDIMLCARSAYVFPHFMLDKVFLGIDFIETTRCAPGDALQWAPSL